MLGGIRVAKSIFNSIYFKIQLMHGGIRVAKSIYNSIISEFQKSCNALLRFVNDKSMTNCAVYLYGTADFCYDSGKGAVV